jgi:DNA-binding transcriptional ArsR family regulator
VAKAAPVFAALGQPTRLRLVSRLCVDGPLSITELSANAGMTRQALTKHLRALAEAGLVCNRRRGREQLWDFEPEPLEDARKLLARISANWDEAIDRLRAFVEK